MDFQDVKMRVYTEIFFTDPSCGSPLLTSRCLVRSTGNALRLIKVEITKPSLPPTLFCWVISAFSYEPLWAPLIGAGGIKST